MARGSQIRYLIAIMLAISIQRLQSFHRTFFSSKSTRSSIPQNSKLASVKMGLLDGLKKIVVGADPTEALAEENDKQLKTYFQKVEKINALEADYEKLSNEQLRAKTDEFKQRLRQGGTLDSILIEAYAVVREASWRVLELRHYDVQLIGGMALNDGRLAEMATGEGKTLVALLPTYLNALTGERW